MKNNLYKYYILKDKNLVIEILKGRFDLSDYMDLKKSQFEDPAYDPNFNLILDIRNIEDILSSEIIKEYTEFIKPVQLFTERIKAAVITDTPSQVTGATLYNLFEDKSIDYRIFSTLEYALNWMGISNSDLKDINFKL
jgi:hypothetical protein